MVALKQTESRQDYCAQRNLGAEILAQRLPTVAE